MTNAKVARLRKKWKDNVRKTCTGCGLYRLLSAFYRGSGKLGHCSQCKQCQSTARKEDYKLLKGT